MVFLARVVIAILVVPHATDVSPAQVPENNCKRAPEALRLEPRLLNVIAVSYTHLDVYKRQRLAPLLISNEVS